MFIYCQNCGIKLAERKEGGWFSYKPVDTESIAQPIDNDNIYMWLKCKSCHCMLQIKT